MIWQRHLAKINIVLEDVQNVNFYGAGCSSKAKNQTVEKALARMFPNAKITIKQSFVPFGEGIEGGEIMLFDNTYVDEVNASGVIKMSIPVTIFDPIRDSNSFGFIVLDTYS